MRAELEEEEDMERKLLEEASIWQSFHGGMISVQAPHLIFCNALYASTTFCIVVLQANADTKSHPSLCKRKKSKSEPMQSKH